MKESMVINDKRKCCQVKSRGKYYAIISTKIKNYLAESLNTVRKCLVCDAVRKLKKILQFGFLSL